MRVTKILSTVAAAILLATTATVCAESKAIDYVEGVDWTRNVVTATGKGLVPPNAVNPAQAKLLAADAARADAFRKLGESVNGVRVEGDKTIGKISATYDRVQTRITATIKGATTISESFVDDETYRVIMQVPMFGTSNSLAGIVLERSEVIVPFPDPVYGVAPTIPRYNSSTPIQERIQIVGEKSSSPVQVIPSTPSTSFKPGDPLIPIKPLPKASTTSIQLTPMNFQPIQAAKKSVADYADMAQGNFTGLIVDCRGLNLKPVMSPVILNVNGTKIYGHKNLDPDKVAAQGMVDYARGLGGVARAGNNPLVVKAMSLENFNSCPVLSIADSNLVLIENYATKFLKDLKVVFLCD